MLSNKLSQVYALDFEKAFVLFSQADTIMIAVITNF